MTIIDDRQNDIICRLNAIDDWMDKYAWLVERGKRLAPMDDVLKTDRNAIAGCQSRVWITAELADSLLCYRIDSDALITRGLAGLLLDVLDRLPPEDILRADLYFIDRTHLASNLSPARAAGLSSIAAHMKHLASDCT